jgi:hypothetical protein
MNPSLAGRAFFNGLLDGSELFSVRVMTVVRLQVHLYRE